MGSIELVEAAWESKIITTKHTFYTHPRTRRVKLTWNKQLATTTYNLLHIPCYVGGGRDVLYKYMPYETDILIGGSTSINFDANFMTTLSA